MIAALVAAGLDGPLVGTGWQERNVDDFTAADWGRLENKLVTLSSSVGHIPFLYYNAHEEDIEFVTTFLVSNPYSGIGFRFAADLSTGWMVTRSGLYTYNHGVVATIITFSVAIADGSVVRVETNGTTITVFDDGVEIGSQTNRAFSQHGTNHGLLQSWIDLSGRWGDTTIDNVTAPDEASSVNRNETQAGGAVFARHRPPDVVIDRPQQGLSISRGPMEIIDGIPYARPMLGASATSMVFPRSFSPTENLADALSIGVNGASSRWLPDTADVEARPGIGSDVTEWVPHFGSNLGFLFHSASAPYVDPAYDYWAAGKRPKVAAAMVFDGDHWGQSRMTGPQPEFTWIIVLVIHHPKDRTWNDVLASPSAATDPLKATDAALRYHNGRVQAYIDGKMSDADLHPPLYKARIRPTILGWAQEETGGTLSVVTANGRHVHSYHHASKAPGFDIGFYLGVNGAAVDVDHASEIDVLDMSYYPTRLSTRHLRKRMNALDHVYGVSGR